MTEETKQKIRIARAKQDPKSLSHPHSPESKLKMSLAHKWLPSKKKWIPTGIPGWNKGKKLPYPVWNKGTKGLMPVPWNKGTKYTEEQINKMFPNKRTKEEISWSKNKRNRLKGYLNKIGYGHTFWEWELLKKQYNYTCPCCGLSEPEIKLTEDHIIPLSKGGSDLIENIQPLCLHCNIVKHTKIIKY